MKPAPGSTAGTQANRALSSGSQVPLGAPLCFRNTAKQTNRISRCILCRCLKLPLGSSQGPPRGPCSPSPLQVKHFHPLPRQAPCLLRWSFAPGTFVLQGTLLLPLEPLLALRQHLHRPASPWDTQSSAPHAPHISLHQSPHLSPGLLQPAKAQHL